MKLKVTSYVPLPNHGGVFPNASRILDDEYGEYTTLSRSFACECGEPLRDGDPVNNELYEQGRYVHANCVDRISTF